MSARTRFGIVAVIAALAIAGGAFFFLPENAPREPAPPAAPVAGTTPETVAANQSVPEASESPPEVAAPETGTERSPAARAKTGPGRIFGKATLPDDAPKSLIQVALHRVEVDSPLVIYEDTLVARADAAADGAFSFDRLPTGAYQLYASTPTHVAQSPAIVTPANTDINLNMRLFPGGTISGRVVDQNRDPVPGANVFVGAHDVGGQKRNTPRERALSSRIVTDADGHFTMGYLRMSTNNEPGYRLAVKAEGFATLLSDYIKAGTANTELTLSEGAVISGSLTKAGTTEPVPDQTVLLESELTFENLAGTTDAEGFFFIPNVPAGTHIAALAGSEFVIVPESGIFEVPANAPSAEVALQVIAGGTVSGRVYNADTSEGLAGIELGTVFNHKYDLHKATTAADGTYRFAGLLPRPHGIRISLPRGYRFAENTTSSPTVTPISGADTPSIDFALSRGMSISGVVVDEAGEPIADANVSAGSDEGRHHGDAKTDERGAFTLSGYPKDVAVRMYANKSGYTMPPTQWNDRPAYKLDKDRSGVVVTLHRAVKVSGTVVDARGNPVQAIRMVAQTASEPPISVALSGSDASGAIEFSDIPPGEYLFGAHSMSSNLIADESAALRVKVAGGKDIAGLRFVISGDPRQRLSISGRVVDLRGNPIAGASASAAQRQTMNRGSTYADATGSFTITGLAPGTYEVRASASQFAPSERVQADAGATGVVLTLKDYARIEGQVLSAQSGLPVPIFSIDYRGEPVTFRDVQGKFVLENVPEQLGSVTVAADGFAAAAVPVPPLTGGQTHHGLMVRLKPGATLTGRVTNREGQPVPGASVYLYTGAEGVFTGSVGGTESAADGTFQLNSLPTGSHTLSAYHENYAGSTRQVVTIALGVQNRADIVLSAGTSIIGTVTMNGTPLSGAEVSADVKDKGGGQARTDAQGRYRIDRLPAGEVKVIASSGQHGLSRHAHTSAAIVEGLVTEINLELNAGTATIEGTIYAEPGVPVRTRMSVSARWDNRDGGVYTRTDANGNFVLDGLPEGLVFLHVHAENGHPKVAGMQLSAGQRAQRDIVLSDGVNLHIQVSGTLADRNFPVRALLCPGGIPLRQATLHQILNNINHIGSAEVAGGQCEFKALEPGMYTVVVWEMDLTAIRLGKDGLSRWATTIVQVTEEQEQTAVQLSL